MSEKQHVAPRALTSAVLGLATKVLKAGGLVVAPTETRYGVLARADRRDVLEKLCRVKARDLNKPTALLVSQPEDMGRLGKLTDAARRLSDEFLPGPLTLILSALKDWFPPAVVDNKIGIRCSSLPLIKQVVDGLGLPLTATSANRSGGAELESIDDIQKEFGDEIDLYLDAGALTGPTSTVVDCSGKGIVILREGAIDRRSIEAALKQPHER
ncbi:MAG: threonylcarbamoyl-AMP synthase [bacterium]|nr:threonylcarbamoyl-AMP synthase [bacterium]